MPASDRTAASDFGELQRRFTAHLRAPDQCAAPPSVEDRRMEVYRELIYNNIESFVSGGFPVLRSLYGDESWHRMVRDFVHRHASRSPYFLHISEEFLHYLQDERGQRDDDPPFLLELAHYEWVELALDVSEEEFPSGLHRGGDVLASIPVVSPLVWSLSYRFPVHRIGPAFRPQEPPKKPTFLLVYRNRADEVGFMEANGVTVRLLQLAGEGKYSGRRLLETLAAEMQHPDAAALVEFGRELLEKLRRLDILAGFKPG